MRRGKGVFPDGYEELYYHTGLIHNQDIEMKRTLAQSHPKLQSDAGMKEMLFREVITSSSIEGIRNARPVLNKWFEGKVLAQQGTPKKIRHKRKV